MTKLIGSIGPPNAKIAIVGEAPGRMEELKGTPFIGPSGKLLDSMLSTAGIPRSLCYLTNIMQTRPLNNNFGAFYLDSSRTNPSPSLIEGRKRLINELKNLKPNITIALGAEPLRALTGQRGIKDKRGYTFDAEVGKVIGTYHPSAVLRFYNLRSVVELDLIKANKESLSPHTSRPDYKFTINPSYLDVIEYIDFLIKEKKRFAFDIETTGRHVRCLGISHELYQAFCIPFTKIRAYSTGDLKVRIGNSSFTNNYTFIEEYVILKRLYDLFISEDNEKIAQNFPFDSTVLAKDFGFVIKNLYLDTLIAHHLCYCELPKSLTFLASMWTNAPSYAEHNTSNDEDEWTYNCMDASITFEIAPLIIKEMIDINVYDFYKEHVQPSMIALTRAENRGILVDLNEIKKQKEVQSKRMEEAKLKLKEFSGRDINPASPKQMAKYLYQDLGLTPQRHRKTKKITTDEGAIDSLYTKYPTMRSKISPIIKYRKAGKLTGYLNATLTSDNLMMTSYNISGTVSGRLSSSVTIWGDGMAIQTAPKDTFRRIFIARPGYVFIKVDLSQAEFRAVAWLADIRHLIDKYLQDPNFDIHTWHASENIYFIPADKVTPAQRSSAKPGVHGGNYGIHARTTSAMYKISYKEAKDTLASYHQALPEIKEWWGQVEEQINRTRTLTTPFGRRHCFYGRLDRGLYRAAYSFVPQSIVADIVNRAIFIIDDKLKTAYPLINMHDELVIECPINDIDLAVPVIKNAFEIGIKINKIPEPLVIPANVEVGKNWYDVVPYEEWKKK